MDTQKISNQAELVLVKASLRKDLMRELDQGQKSAPCQAEPRLIWLLKEKPIVTWLGFALWKFKGQEVKIVLPMDDASEGES